MGRDDRFLINDRNVCKVWCWAFLKKMIKIPVRKVTSLTYRRDFIDVIDVIDLIDVIDVIDDRNVIDVMICIRCLIFWIFFSVFSLWDVRPPKNVFCEVHSWQKVFLREIYKMLIESLYLYGNHKAVTTLIYSSYWQIFDYMLTENYSNWQKVTNLCKHSLHFTDLSHLKGCAEIYEMYHHIQKGDLMVSFLTSHTNPRLYAYLGYHCLHLYHL